MVVKGFSQVEGIYFNEAFSFVAQMEPNSNYACNCNNSKDLKMHQMDVQINFLDGDLLDYIYIYIYNNQKGFVFKGKKNMVCKLMKYLSGLKQSPHAWNLYLVLKEFERSSINYNVYFQIFQSDFYVIMTLYIDDFILAFNDLILFDRNKGQCFK